MELARSSLEEKAEQLTIISKYKSEFLANMSHELRTPLNSLLILAKLLADNKDGNLSGKQVEYANTIYACGGDLLSLINEILDLSKVEAGKMQVEPRDILLSELNEFVDRCFRPVAEQKKLDLHRGAGARHAAHHPHGPAAAAAGPQEPAVQRLQVHRPGSVKLVVKPVEQGRALRTTRCCARRRRVIAFAVTDTGIGIPKDKQKLIFEAFQQADGSTARKYGGTGLGLSISREIAKLLGGEIHVESEPGKGSTFTLYLPPEYVGPDDEARLGLHAAHAAGAAEPLPPAEAHSAGSWLHSPSSYPTAPPWPRTGTCWTRRCPLRRTRCWPRSWWRMTGSTSARVTASCSSSRTT